MDYNPENKFFSTNLENIDLSKMAVKASYRDLVLYIKLGDFYYNLLDEKYVQMIDHQLPHINENLQHNIFLYLLLYH